MQISAVCRLGTPLDIGMPAEIPQSRAASAASVRAVIKFALKVVILAAVFYGLTRFDVLPGLDVHPEPGRARSASPAPTCGSG